MTITYQNVTVSGITYRLTINSSSTASRVGTVYATTSALSTTVYIQSNVTYSGKSYKITSINGSVFKDKTNITLVNVGTNMEYISPSAFEGCTSLVTAELNSGLKTIASRAFKNCTALTTVVLAGQTYMPNCEIQYEAFYGCTNLNVSYHPSYNKTSIGDKTFYNCTSLTLQSLPNSITFIGESAFEGCTNVSLQSLPSNLTTIQTNAFKDVQLPENLILPDNVSIIQERAFGESKTIRTVSLKGTMPIGTSQYSYDGSGLKSGLAGCTNVEEFIIRTPSQFFKYGDNVYYRYSASDNRIHLSAVPPATDEKVIQLYEGTNTIDSYALADCSSVEYIDMSNIHTIGQGAFLNCSSLAISRLSGNISTIYKDAFKNCTSIEEIVIPPTDETLNFGSINSESFSGCSVKRLAFFRNIYFIANDAFSNTEIEEVLDFGDNNMSPGSYGLPDTVVIRNSIPAIGYLGGISGILAVTRYVDANNSPTSLNDMIYSVILRLDPLADVKTIQTIADGLCKVITIYGGDVSDCTTVGELLCRIISLIDPDYDVSNLNSISDMLVALTEVYEDP